MRTMKKLLCTAITATMCAAMLAGCGSSDSSTSESSTSSSEAASSEASATADTSDAKIGIIAMVENGAFMDMKTGIINELKANGYTDDNIDYQCASGDSTALSTIANNMADGSYDLVFTIATPPTQAMVNLESDTPTFFCAVSAPVAAGVITSMDEAPDKNATGTSNAIPVSEIIDLAQATTPGEKYGLIYSGNEDNATNTISQCKEYLDELGIEYVEKTAPTSSDVETATNALIAEGVDVIFVPNDSIIQDGVDTLVDICRENKIPTYASSATTVASGCFATLAIDDIGIGEKTADMALEYLNGTALTDINAQVVGIDYCSVNTTTMDALGLSSDSIQTSYEINEME